MARAHIRHVVRMQGRPVEDALVQLLQVGTSTEITDTLYATRTGLGELANPLVTNDQGEAECWLEVPGGDTPGTIDVLVSDNDNDAHFAGSTSSLSWETFRETVEVYPAPEDVSTGSELPESADGLYLRRLGGAWAGAGLSSGAVPLEASDYPFLEEYVPEVPASDLAQFTYAVDYALIYLDEEIEAIPQLPMPLSRTFAGTFWPYAEGTAPGGATGDGWVGDVAAEDLEGLTVGASVTVNIDSPGPLQASYSGTITAVGGGYIEFEPDSYGGDWQAYVDSPAGYACTVDYAYVIPDGAPLVWSTADNAWIAGTP